MRIFTLIFTLLSAPALQADTLQISTANMDKIINVATYNFWGRYEDKQGNILEPKSERERRTLPIPRRTARSLITYSLYAGIAEKCKQDPQKILRHMKQIARSTYGSDKQVAFVDFLNHVAQGNVYAALEGRSCTPRLEKQLKRFVRKL